MPHKRHGGPRRLRRAASVRAHQTKTSTGMRHEIEVCDEHRKDIDEVLAAIDSFTAHARRIGPNAPQQRKGQAVIAPAKERSKSDYDADAVREWTQANIVKVSERGKISTTVLEQYRAAQGEPPPPAHSLAGGAEASPFLDHRGEGPAASGPGGRHPPVPDARPRGHPQLRLGQGQPRRHRRQAARSDEERRPRGDPLHLQGRGAGRVRAGRQPHGGRAAQPRPRGDPPRVVQNKDKRYPVLGFYRGDVTVILGLRQPVTPKVIAAYATSLLQHDTHRVGHTGGGGGKRSASGLPCNPRQVVSQLGFGGAQPAAPAPAAVTSASEADGKEARRGRPAQSWRCTSTTDDALKWVPLAGSARGAVSAGRKRY